MAQSGKSIHTQRIVISGEKVQIQRDSVEICESPKCAVAPVRWRISFNDLDERRYLQNHQGLLVYPTPTREFHEHAGASAIEGMSKIGS